MPQHHNKKNFISIFILIAKPFWNHYQIIHSFLMWATKSVGEKMIRFIYLFIIYFLLSWSFHCFFIYIFILYDIGLIEKNDWILESTSILMFTCTKIISRADTYSWSIVYQFLSRIESILLHIKSVKISL